MKLTPKALHALNNHIIEEAPTYADVVRMVSSHCYELAEHYRLAGPIYPIAVREHVAWCLDEGCLYWHNPRHGVLLVADVFYNEENPRQEIFQPDDAAGDDPCLLYVRLGNLTRDRMCLLLTIDERRANLSELQACTKANPGVSPYVALAVEAGKATHACQQVQRAAAVPQAATAPATTPGTPTVPGMSC